MRYRVLPYKQGSKGAKALATALGGKVLKLTGSSFVPKLDDIIINWGNTDLSVSALAQWGGTLNPALTIKNASNKLNFFRLMRDNDLSELIPLFWEQQHEIPSDAYPVVCRTVLAGHSGDGIVIAGDSSSVVPASLYVKYVKKIEEYRIHVGMKLTKTEIYDEAFAASLTLPAGASYAGSTEYKNEPVIIAVQRKARDLSCPNPNWQVRNRSGGFIYVRGGVNPPEGVMDAARRALVASGLDFGAVDVIYNEEKQRAYVLEINTAPGLEGQTVDDYANFFTTI